MSLYGGAPFGATVRQCAVGCHRTAVRRWVPPYGSAPLGATVRQCAVGCHAHHRDRRTWVGRPPVPNPARGCAVQACSCRPRAARSRPPTPPAHSCRPCALSPAPHGAQGQEHCAPLCRKQAHPAWRWRGVLTADWGVRERTRSHPVTALTPSESIFWAEAILGLAKPGRFPGNAVIPSNSL